MPIIEFNTSFYIFQVDCKFKWITTPCSKTCVDDGPPPTKVIEIRIIQPPSFGGRPCPRISSSRMVKKCFAPRCPPPEPQVPGKFSSNNVASSQKHYFNPCLICDWDWFITLQIVGIKQTASHVAAADITYHQNALKKSWAMIWSQRDSIRHTPRSTWLKA